MRESNLGLEKIDWELLPKSAFKKCEKEEGYVYDYTIDVPIWGNMVNEIGIDFDISGTENDSKENAFNKVFEDIKKLLQWLDNNKKVVEEAIIEDDFLDLADDWTASLDTVEIDGKEYRVDEEGIYIEVPISREQFCNGFYFNSIGIDVEELEDSTFNIELSIFIDIEPDYFAGHSIELYIDSNHNIQVNGLAG